MKEKKFIGNIQGTEESPAVLIAKGKNKVNINNAVVYPSLDKNELREIGDYIAKWLISTKDDYLEKKHETPCQNMHVDTPGESLANIVNQIMDHIRGWYHGEKIAVSSTAYDLGDDSLLGFYQIFDDHKYICISKDKFNKMLKEDFDITWYESIAYMLKEAEMIRSRKSSPYIKCAGIECLAFDNDYCV